MPPRLGAHPSSRSQGGKGDGAHVGVTYEAPLDGTRHQTERERAELAVTAARQNLEAARLSVITS